MLDGLDLIVWVAPCYDAYPITSCIYSLMMYRVDAKLWSCVDAGEPRIRLYDTDSMYLFVSSLWLEVLFCCFYVLLECTAVCDIEELHSFTDSENWLPTRKYPPHSIDKEGVIGMDNATCSIRFLTIECWIDIDSTRKNKTRTEFYIVTDIISKYWNHNDQATRVLDRINIIAGKIIENPTLIFTILCEYTNLGNHKTSHRMTRLYWNFHILQVLIVQLQFRTIRRLELLLVDSHRPYHSYSHRGRRYRGILSCLHRHHYCMRQSL